VQECLVLTNGSSSSDYGINATGSITILDSAVYKNHCHQIVLANAMSTLRRLTIDAYGATDSTCILGAAAGGDQFCITDCILAGARNTTTYPAAFYNTVTGKMRSRVRNIIGYDNTPNLLGNIYGAENIYEDTDPLFNDRTLSDYRLKVGSPAAGRGTDGGNIGFDPRHLTNLRTVFADMAA
jgi:hypothetical protein